MPTGTRVRQQFEDNPTTDLYLEAVMKAKSCSRHWANINVPCFTIPRESGGDSIGICNDRAIRAGFNSPIDPRSLTAWRKKNTSGRFNRA